MDWRISGPSIVICHDWSKNIELALGSVEEMEGYTEEVLSWSNYETPAISQGWQKDIFLQVFGELPYLQNNSLKLNSTCPAFPFSNGDTFSSFFLKMNNVIV
eukprot:scaffold2784_cov109-Cylindrotheca_fusiformis.AAC.6